VMVSLHKVVDREVILSVVEPRATPNNLLELDYRVDRAHQYDIADVCERPRRLRASATL